jgi:hypothetical protein
MSNITVEPTDYGPLPPLDPDRITLDDDGWANIDGTKPFDRDVAGQISSASYGYYLVVERMLGEAYNEWNVHLRHALEVLRDLNASVANCPNDEYLRNELKRLNQYIDGIKETMRDLNERILDNSRKRRWRQRDDEAKIGAGKYPILEPGANLVVSISNEQSRHLQRIDDLIRRSRDPEQIRKLDQERRAIIADFRRRLQDAIRKQIEDISLPDNNPEVPGENASCRTPEQT